MGLHFIQMHGLCGTGSDFLITAYAYADLSHLMPPGSPYLINGSELAIRIYSSTRHKTVN